MKKNNQGWEQLLFYDIRRLEAIEEELKMLLPELLKKTTSLRLSTVLQKYVIFNDESINKLNIIIKEGGIGVLLQTHTIFSSLWRDAKEKLHYCDTTLETDYCIHFSLLSICALKIQQYQQAACLSEQLSHPLIKNTLQLLSENETRVFHWLIEWQEKEKIEQEDLPLNNSIHRQAYWLL